VNLPGFVLLLWLARALADFSLKLMDIDSEHLAIPETEYSATVRMPAGTHLCGRLTSAQASSHRHDRSICSFLATSMWAAARLAAQST